MSTATGTASDTAATVTIAKVGQPAPDFNMPSTKNIDTLAENVKLADYKGKWLILLCRPIRSTRIVLGSRLRRIRTASKVLNTRSLRT